MPLCLSVCLSDCFSIVGAILMLPFGGIKIDNNKLE